MAQSTAHEGNTKWTCPACKESNESDFDICWQCGTSSDGRTDSQFRSEVGPRYENTTCSKCGYLLYALTTDRCPECGHTFDRIVRDTVPPPPTSERLQRKRRFWLYATMLVWMSIPVMGLIFEYWYDESPVMADVLDFAGMVLLAAVWIAPAMFLLSLCERDK
jgi:predicted amidophosphoribosyltransferase